MTHIILRIKTRISNKAKNLINSIVLTILNLIGDHYGTRSSLWNASEITFTILY